MKKLLSLLLFPLLAHSQAFNVFQPGGNLAATYTTCPSGSTWNCQALGAIPAFSVLNNATGSSAVPTAQAQPEITALGVGTVAACNGFAGSGCVASQAGLITLGNPAGTQGTFIMEVDAVGTSVNGGVLAIISGSGSAPNGTGGSTDHYAGKGQGSGNGGSMGLLGGDALGSGNGGQLNLGSGNSSTGSGGQISFVAGQGKQGGAINFTSGISTGGNNGGGPFNLQGGTGNGTGPGGTLTIMGGNGGVTGNGGEIDIFGGNPGGAAEVSGNIVMQGGLGASVAFGSDILLEDFNGDITWSADRYGNAYGSLATATNATDRFLYLGSSAGVPTGVPAHLTGNYAGSFPARFDSTDNRLYVYNSGWQQIGSAGAIPLTGTTGSIGGSLLAAGACSSGTVAITGSTTSQAVIATPVTYPGDGNYWLGYVSAGGTITVKVCAAVAGTPGATAYNVRVIQ